MLHVGVTGGIGSGKSTVVRLFHERGAPVLDLDAAAREVTAPGCPALQEIAAALGPEMIRPDGSLDRGRVGALVFQDPDARRRLEAIVHPAIRQVWEMWVRQLRESIPPPPVIVVEVQLLFESQLESRVDRIVLVTARTETRAARLESSRKMSPEAIRGRIESQLPDDQKRVRSHYVIENDGSMEDLEAAVESVWLELNRESGS